MHLARPLFLMLIAATHPAWGQTDHTYALMSAGEKAYELIDVEGKTADDTGVSFWVLEIRRDPENRIDHSLKQYKINCTESRIGSLYLVDYDIHRAVLARKAASGAMTPVVPNSVGETYASFICHGQRPFPDVPDAKSIGVAISASKQVMAQLGSKVPLVESGKTSE